MNEQTVKHRVLEVIRSSPTPLTCPEIAEAAGVGVTGVYILTYKLREERLIRRRQRPNPGRARAMYEYFIEPPKQLEPTSKDFADEVPDEVWWREQEARGFKRPDRFNRNPNIRYA